MNSIKSKLFRPMAFGFIQEHGHLAITLFGFDKTAEQVAIERVFVFIGARIGFLSEVRGEVKAGCIL